MKLKYRGVSYEYNPPIVVTPNWQTRFTNISEKARWLFLEQARSSKRRSVSMLARSAQEIGLI
ncbi:MAG: DUF4278 domain-containing protein [Prochloraceae cyanobacterium]|nr:DUF4278 domain-containing protein [Prochloraceae cyanobacterium]